ncbi:YciI family protein [Arthrobacter sp. HY1533]|uniref:YciI family protein n=1 Tax=Arthrobacter sp. HY1533 TaxID=2970919 RepID=UPI0022BA00F1|nr:YciI family protein [Arthrobacter sp. HY1533]
MSKFIYIYNGPATPMDQFTEEQSAAVTAEWGAWMGKVGTAMLDAGAPFGARAAVSDDGSDASPGLLQGYSIVEADSLDAAKALADGHPFLSEGKGRFSLEIFELADMGGM